MNRKGQALIEFILILPIFIMILFAVVDFGMILSKKSELENDSTDIVMMIKNGNTDEEIKNMYKDIEVVIDKDDKYINIELFDSIRVMTPGLNLVLGNPYKVSVKRSIPNETE